MKRLTIQRSKWARGGINGVSALLNEQGNMCCLGFYAKKMGATDEEIQCTPSPVDLLLDASGERKKSLLTKLQGLIAKRWQNNTKLCARMMRVNDGADKYGDITPERRESLLTKMFLKLGTKVRFVD